MEKYVYPAVFYYDENVNLYCAAIKDMGLYIDGENVEDAHKSISILLEAYIKAAHKYGEELPEPSSFNELIEKNPREIVMLVEVKL